MLQAYEHQNLTTPDGDPAGGYVKGVGLSIQWQDGPLGSGDDRQEPNGAFLETVIDACIKRLEHHQSGPFSCDENQRALSRLRDALFWLTIRTQRREERGIEGQHII